MLFLSLQCMDRERRFAAVKYYLTRPLFVKSFNRCVSYYHTCLSLCCRKQSCQVALDTHIFIKSFNRLVKYCLTRVIFAAEFYYRFVKYCLTRYFLLKVLTVLSSTAWQEYFCYKDSTILSSTAWQKYFCRRVLTVLSSTTWHVTFC